MNQPSLRKSIQTFPEGFRNFSSDIKLTGVARIKFLRSEWESLDFSDSSVVSIPYLLYRAVFCSYFLVFLCLSIINYEQPGYWILLATNWSFLTQTAYATLNFLNVFIFWTRQKSRCGFFPLGKKNTQSCLQPPFYHVNINAFESTVWFLLNLAYSIVQFISITYWLFVYNAADSEAQAANYVGWSLTVHGINAVLLIIDAFIVATPINVTHFIYPVFMNGVYLLFTGLYEVAGGDYAHADEGRNYIYPILNWRESPEMAAVTCVIATTTVTLFHFMFWLLHIVRIHLAENFRPGSRKRVTFEDYENSDYENENKPLLDKQRASC